MMILSEEVMIVFKQNKPNKTLVYKDFISLLESKYYNDQPFQEHNCLQISLK